MSDIFSFLPFIIMVVVGGIMFMAFGPVVRRYVNRRKLLQTGTLSVADVVSASQTGVAINSQPEMRVVLALENVGGTPRRAEAGARPGQHP